MKVSFGSQILFRFVLCIQMSIVSIIVNSDMSVYTR